MPQCLKSKILKQTNPECNFLSHSGLKTAAVQKLLRLSFTYPAAGEGAYVGWAEAAISLSLPSHRAQALHTVLLLPEKRKRQPRNVIGQDKPEKKKSSVWSARKNIRKAQARAAVVCGWNPSCSGTGLSSATGSVTCIWEQDGGKARRALIHVADFVLMTQEHEHGQKNLALV